MEEGVGGYDCQWFDVGEETLRERELICSVCTGVYKDPIILLAPDADAACHHTFCKSCLNGWIARASNCPLCRAPLGNCVPDKAVERRISDLKLKCNQCEAASRLCSPNASAFWALHCDGVCLGVKPCEGSAERSSDDSVVEKDNHQEEEEHSELIRVKKELTAVKKKLETSESARVRDRRLMNDIITKQTHLWEQQKNLLLYGHQMQLRALFNEIIELRRLSSLQFAPSESGTSRQSLHSGLEKLACRLTSELKVNNVKSDSSTNTNSSSLLSSASDKLGRLSSRLDKLREQLGQFSSEDSEESLDSRLEGLMHWRNQIGAMFSSMNSATDHQNHLQLPRSRH
eukprot:TRINITY_DN32694_c0_g1_i1.p1 TRINITY_DN32694_c0_g1~~TRINITY_DN32694_c0_g1_i1.p1  ORF type:complete len:344 (+),score=49.84 TRINITY_DN32694_c0_g1_i1:87-1118(+)